MRLLSLTLSTGTHHTSCAVLLTAWGKPSGNVRSSEQVTKEVLSLNEERLADILGMDSRSFAFWKKVFSNRLEGIKEALESSSVPEVLEEEGITVKDLKVMELLQWFSPEEIERYGLPKIKEASKR